MVEQKTKTENGNGNLGAVAQPPAPRQFGRQECLSAEPTLDAKELIVQWKHLMYEKLVYKGEISGRNVDGARKIALMLKQMGVDMKPLAVEFLGEHKWCCDGGCHTAKGVSDELIGIYGIEAEVKQFFKKRMMELLDRDERFDRSNALNIVKRYGFDLDVKTAEKLAGHCLQRERAPWFLPDHSGLVDAETILMLVSDTAGMDKEIVSEVFERMVRAGNERPRLMSLEEALEQGRIQERNKAVQTILWDYQNLQNNGFPRTYRFIKGAIEIARKYELGEEKIRVAALEGLKNLLELAQETEKIRPWDIKDDFFSLCCVIREWTNDLNIIKERWTKSAFEKALKHASEFGIPEDNEMVVAVRKLMEDFRARGSI